MFPRPGRLRPLAVAWDFVVVVVVVIFIFLAQRGLDIKAAHIIYRANYGTRQKTQSMATFL